MLLRYPGAPVFAAECSSVGGGSVALPRLSRLISCRRCRSRRIGVSVAMALQGENHYRVLGVSRSSTLGDIKKAYRLLARKEPKKNGLPRLASLLSILHFWGQVGTTSLMLGLRLCMTNNNLPHLYGSLFRGIVITPMFACFLHMWHPDVNKDSRAGEVFKSVRLAYEVLSNEASRLKYDRELRACEGFNGSARATSYSPNLEDMIRHMAELKKEMREKQYREQYRNTRGTSFFYSETAEDFADRTAFEQRGSFLQVIESAFISLFLMQTIGCRLSLTFSSLMALFDTKLDLGYKLAHMVAWCLGGKGGILLTLFLSFASWACGKTSSSTVAVVVLAMWVGSSLARCCPIPQGAILALIYMSIKLQANLN